MAKGKRAAALFEVIQQAKQKEQLRATGGGFLTPSWWFKSKSAPNGAAAHPPEPVAKPAPAPRPAPTLKNVLPARPAPIVPEIHEPEPEFETEPQFETEPEVETVGVTDHEDSVVEE